jgi:hypothetical protein
MDLTLVEKVGENFCWFLVAMKLQDMGFIVSFYLRQLDVICSFTVIAYRLVFSQELIAEISWISMAADCAVIHDEHLVALLKVVV